MYTDGFESLEEAERGSRPAFKNVSETEKLLRENEKLKKSLEKEQFFNKLLDQEIQELKMAGAPGAPRQEFHSEYWEGSRGVSKGAFYMLLIVTLVLAAYIGYGIYYDKPINYLGIGKARPATVIQNDPAVNTPASAVPDNTVTPTPPATFAAKDSVPNIIGEKKAVVTPPAANLPATNQKDAANQKEKPGQKAAQKAAIVPAADADYNEDEVNAAINSDSQKAAPVAAVQKPEEETRPVIGRYKVTSKANFYNSPDENSMRGTFISGSINKVVEARDEKNGFIFVVYTNDLGYTSKGWLSKQDLTKE